VKIPRLLVGLACVLIALASCSSHEQHPPQIGDCTGPANACINAKVGSGAPSITDGGSCGVLSFREPCQTCVETNCCSLVGLCSNNADCLSLAVDCVGKCTTQSCVDDCKIKMPNAVGDFDALDQCLSTSCSDACGAGDAGISTPSEASVSVGQSCGRLSYQSVACQSCVESNCCDPAEMCSSDPDCFLYVQCRAMCSPADTRCNTDCQTTNPRGFTGFGNLAQCLESKCTTQCQ
jgi:hypothetical protein